MLPVMIAATSAALWGSGDFCGGKASQRANTLAVTVLSQLVGLPVLLICIVALGGTAPRGAGVGAVGWGAAAGVAGFVGILLLYRGLAQGAMTIFAPVTAVTAAILPLLVGLATASWPSTPALVGVVCAIVAIALVSTAGGGSDRAARTSPRLIGLALMSGLLFGVFFALLGRIGPGHGMWPLIGVRLGSLSVGLATVVRTRTSLRLSGPPLRWTVAAGQLDIIANALYVVAATHGVLTLVAPVAALYPVSTVLLALVVDRERMQPAQLAGLGLAATALVLVAT